MNKYFIYIKLGYYEGGCKFDIVSLFLIIFFYGDKLNKFLCFGYFIIKISRLYIYRISCIRFLEFLFYVIKL